VTVVSSGALPANTFEVLAKMTTAPGYGDACPGNSLSFPWLSQIASNFEKYKFHKLTYHLFPSASSSQSGRVYASFDYDYDDFVPATITEMMCGESTIESSCWTPFSVSVDIRTLNRDQPYRFVSTQTRNNFIEPRTSYAGFLVIATIVPTPLSWDLYVEYDVELDGPTLENSQFFDDFSSTTNLYVTELLPLVPSGTKRVRWLKPSQTGNQIRGNPLHTAIPGQEGTPAMTGIFDSLAPTDAPEVVFDLRDLEGKGLIEWAIDYMSSATSPGSFDAQHTSLEVAICDASGKKLCNLTQAAPGGLLGYFLNGASEQGVWSTSGKYVRSFCSLALPQLLPGYPTAAYAAVGLFAETALGAIGGSFHAGARLRQ
jgi:hypothetical protein